MRRHYVRGHFRGQSTSIKRYARKDPFSFLVVPIMLIIALVFLVWVIKQVWVIIVGIVAFILLIFILRKLVPRLNHKGSIALITLALIGLVVFSYIFASQTEPISIDNNPIKIANLTRYPDAMRVQLLPTKDTHAETPYRITLDNGITTVAYDVKWSQLELDINKPITLKDSITKDEYDAWTKNKSYKTTSYELKHQRNPIILIAGLAFFGICLLPVVYPIIRNRRKHQYSQWLKDTYYFMNVRCQNCHQHIIATIPRGTPLLGYNFKCYNCSVSNTIANDAVEIPSDRIYSTRKHCPNCGRMNDFIYQKGQAATGTTRVCSKCGNRYG